MTKKETTKNDHLFKVGNKVGKQFSSEYQPSGEAKSLGWVKKKTLEELKESILNKAFKIADEKLDDPELSATEFQNIFNKAVEMSGFKKDKIDTTIKSYSLFEEETENKAEKLESEQQSKKTNKK